MRLKISHSGKSTVVTSILIAVIFNLNGFSEAQSKWEESEQSPYLVGFRTMELYDHSRTSLEKYDYFGNPIDRETARPIQICIWYPAENPENNLPMVFSEYNFPYPEDNRFIDYISEIQNREIAYLQRLLQGDQAMVLDILNDEVGAVRDASFANGQFPLIIYISDAGHGISENFGLMEYLAGHGYMVAAVHSTGAYQLNPGANPVDLEALTRDVEFAISSLKDHPEVNKNKMGLLGCGFGADAALLLKMRNYDIDALVCLDNIPTDYDRIELLKGNPFFNPQRVNVPVLHIVGKDESRAGAGILDSLEFASRYFLRFLSDSDLCFTEYDNLIAMKMNQSGELSSANKDSHRAIHSYTLKFFEAFLKKNEEAKSYLTAKPDENNIDPNLLRVIYSPGKQAPPTEPQFMSIINEKGVETATQLYRKFKPDYPDHIFFREGTFNIMGYRYLQSGRVPEALAIFELNADAYPNSANVWDSYGEACLTVGDYQKALKNYKKALEILPQDINISGQMRNLIQESAPQQITRLEELIKESSE